jgi:hypothetical protein
MTEKSVNWITENRSPQGIQNTEPNLQPINHQNYVFVPNYEFAHAGCDHTITQLDSFVSHW